MTVLTIFSVKIFCIYISICLHAYIYKMQMHTLKLFCVIVQVWHREDILISLFFLKEQIQHLPTLSQEVQMDAYQGLPSFWNSKLSLLPKARVSLLVDLPWCMDAIPQVEDLTCRWKKKLELQLSDTGGNNTVFCRSARHGQNRDEESCMLNYQL